MKFWIHKKDYDRFSKIICFSLDMDESLEESYNRFIDKETYKKMPLIDFFCFYLPNEEKEILKIVFNKNGETKRYNFSIKSIEEYPHLITEYLRKLFYE